jgi:hypothetical protein
MRSRIEPFDYTREAFFPDGHGVVMDSRTPLSKMPSLATKAQVGESLFHQVISQMTNVRFDLRRWHSLFC